MLKAVLVFCQKSAKIMLIFLKSDRGLHKNAHFYPIFLNIEYYIFQIFINFIYLKVLKIILFFVLFYFILFFDP